MSALVAVVDDDEILRDAMKESLSSVGIAVSTFASAQDLLADPALALLRCVVMDVRMPGLSGLEALRRMREKGLQTAVIFVTGHGDVDMAVSAMKLGAVDFLQKPFREQTLIDIVQEALARSAEPAADVRINSVRERFTQLTPREREVFFAVARGLRSKQIAGELGISQKTVEEYRHRIFEKMQVRSATELASVATELRLLGIG